jgi:hypothetical protein
VRASPKPAGLRPVADAPVADALGDRWEHGSDFHLSLESGPAQYPWTALPSSLWGSGRDALCALVEWGREAHGWRRLLVPSYFCQEVLVPIKPKIEIEVYPCTPTSDAVATVEGDATDIVLLAALFGMAPTTIVTGRATIVEDVSHDPIGPRSVTSTAHYALASLRKTLPLPDGGVLWSPLGLEVPPERPVTVGHAQAALDRLSAMALKMHYLAGQPIAREEIRRLAKRGEDAIGCDLPSGITPFSRSRLATLPAAPWRAARATNLAAFIEALGEVPEVRVLDASFAATLVFSERSMRDRVRDALVAARIYPAVLWSLDDPVIPGITAGDVDLAHRILSIHCDYRYTPSDMVRVASVIRGAAGTP